jgi:hypothetical protein
MKEWVKEAALANQKRGKRADEHGGNQRRRDEQSFGDLTSRWKFVNCDRRSGSFLIISRRRAEWLAKRMAIR